MKPQDDLSPFFSPKAARILSQFKWYDSIEAFRAAHPEITDKDIEEVTAEVRALVGPVGGFGPDLFGPAKPAKPGRKKKAASSDSSKTKRQTSRGGDAYQLKITLRHSKPPIWRRVVVPADLTLGGLHAVIQIAMGWQNCHLHMFEIGGQRFSAEPQDDGGWDSEDLDETDYRLSDVIKRIKTKFRYEYDFGDGWDHEILVEKIIPASEKPQVMVCLTGKNRCPPEDSGGLWGYYDKLEAVSDPKHPEHEDILEWMGEIDPTEFDKDDVNARLARLKE